ncbi:hypothetical protein [Mesorhizobium sp. M0814]|uniref:hypothetical protein n=1 Tax=unclassified Mesorhizobium TaxID=325217 RepID=UPI00333BA87B
MFSRPKVFHKNCSWNIAASPMSRFSMRPWGRELAGQIGKAMNPENDAGGEKEKVHCRRNFQPSSIGQRNN